MSNILLPSFFVIAIINTISISAQTTTTSSTTRSTPPSAMTMTTPSMKSIDENVNRIYAFVKTLKGAKDLMLKQLDEKIYAEMKTVPNTPATNEYFSKMFDLVSKRLTKDDPLTLEDFKKFADLEIMKWKATAPKNN